MAAHRGRANRSGMSPVQYRTATGTARARQASGEAETAVGDGGRAGREGACAGRAEGVRGRTAPRPVGHTRARNASAWGMPGAGEGRPAGPCRAGPARAPPPRRRSLSPPSTPVLQSAPGAPVAPVGAAQVSSGNSDNSKYPSTPSSPRGNAAFIILLRKALWIPSSAGTPVVASTPFPPAPCRRKPTTSRHGRGRERALAHRAGPLSGVWAPLACGWAQPGDAT